MATVIERAQGRYEVRAVEFGKVYRWCPERVVVECDCGGRPALTLRRTTCGCGADHADAVRADAVRAELETLRPPDEALRPWRYAEEDEDAGLPC